MKLSSSSKKTANGLGLIILVSILTVMIAGFLMANETFREFLESVEAYADDNMLTVAGLYVLVQAAVVILLFPGLIFTLMAGYLFGPVIGTLVMVSGTVIGASTAFMIARFAFSDYFQGVLDRNPTFSVIAESVAHDGWKTVMLTRTIPLFPFKLSNYCFGVIPISLSQFAAGTMVGVIPLTVTNVSVGALAADLGSLLEGESTLGVAQYGVIALGIVSGIVTFLLIRKRAKEKFARLDAKKTDDTLPDSCEGSRG